MSKASNTKALKAAMIQAQAEYDAASALVDQMIEQDNVTEEEFYAAYDRENELAGIASDARRAYYTRNVPSETLELVAANID